MADKEPQYLNEYADLMGRIGVAAFRVRYRGTVLIGLGMVAKVSERPMGWRRRTLASHHQIDAVSLSTISERVWRLRKSAGGSRNPMITLGASADNDIVIAEYTLSSQHCAFGYDAAGMTICDLGSLNGTKVKGRLIESNHNLRLHNKSTIVAGRMKFEFLNEDDFTEKIQRTLNRRRRKKK